MSQLIRHNCTVDCALRAGQQPPDIVTRTVRQTSGTFGLHYQAGHVVCKQYQHAPYLLFVELVQI